MHDVEESFTSKVEWTLFFLLKPSLRNDIIYTTMNQIFLNERRWYVIKTTIEGSKYDNIDKRNVPTVALFINGKNNFLFI